MPAFSDSLDFNVIHGFLDRSRGADPYTGELLKGIVASVKELEQRNRALEDQNEKLLAALRKAREKTGVLEHSAGTNPELPKLAFATTAQPIELAASPFRTFAAISAFHKSLVQSPGVTDVELRGFDKGRVVMTIKHAGPLPLVGALMEMDGFDLQLVSFTPTRIEFRVRSDPSDRPAGGEESGL